MKRGLITFVVVYAVLITGWLAWKSYGKYEIQVVWKNQAKATLQNFLDSVSSSQRLDQGISELPEDKIKELKFHLFKGCKRLQSIEWDDTAPHHYSLWLIETADGGRFLLTLENTSPRTWFGYDATAPEYKIIKIE